jgi:hypothetical protein
MFAIAEVDTRTGKQLGIGGSSADIPAYKIFNDARHNLATLATSLIELEFRGARGRENADVETRKTLLRHNLRALTQSVVTAETRARDSRDPALSFFETSDVSRASHRSERQS